MTAPLAPAKPKTDAFEAALASPRTKRLDGCTFAVMLRGDGSADLLIHHGGLTMAAGFSAEQAAVLAAALSPRPAPPPQPAGDGAP